MRTLMFIALISATADLFGQSGSSNLILTKEQNEKWFLQLKHATLKSQIELINARFAADTAVFVPNRTDRYREEHLNGRVPGYCKPIIVTEDVVINFENDTKGRHVLQLNEMLNLKAIESIEIIPLERARAIYGSRGDCGVISVILKDKSTLKKWKQLDKEMHPATTVK